MLHTLTALFSWIRETTLSSFRYTLRLAGLIALTKREFKATSVNHTQFSCAHTLPAFWFTDNHKLTRTNLNFLTTTPVIRGYSIKKYSFHIVILWERGLKSSKIKWLPTVCHEISHATFTVFRGWKDIILWWVSKREPRFLVKRKMGKRNNLQHAIFRQTMDLWAGQCYTWRYT
jgi:hypothetical protein